MNERCCRFVWHRSITNRRYLLLFVHRSERSNMSWKFFFVSEHLLCHPRFSFLIFRSLTYCCRSLMQSIRNSISIYWCWFRRKWWVALAMTSFRSITAVYWIFYFFFLHIFHFTPIIFAKPTFLKLKKVFHSRSHRPVCIVLSSGNGNGEWLHWNGDQWNDKLLW